jgi:predicted dehydrogenase
MILILGGGFGLYGHLPALLAAGRNVATLDRYRPTIESRPELQTLIPQISWFADEEAAIAEAEAVVLARRPRDNASMALRLASNNGRQLIIEKPPAVSPGEAIALAGSLVQRGQSWASPYLFAYCDWFEPLNRSLRGGAEAHIDWRIRHSNRNGSWKLDTEEGGGDLAYYFIHCLAMTVWAMPEATPVVARSVTSTGEAYLAIEAEDSVCRLTFNFHLCDKDSRFELVASDGLSRSDRTPFGIEPKAGVPDPRIPPLRRFYEQTVFGDRLQTPLFHDRVLRLWMASDSDLNHPRRAGMQPEISTARESAPARP